NEYISIDKTKNIQITLVELRDFLLNNQYANKTKTTGTIAGIMESNISVWKDSFLSPITNLNGTPTFTTLGTKPPTTTTPSKVADSVKSFNNPPTLDTSF